ncbi:MAG: alkaline phosphatase family protein [Prosthecobacter sp.]|nr:alkaline phosphatase family protein [Prosthecobacter sp.]
MLRHLSAALFLTPLLAAAAPRSAHVFVISFDGGNPQIMQQADMPHFQRLVAEGAHTFSASTIVPSKTLPSHTSMLTGVDIAKHGVDWNDYLPIRGTVRLPTVFDLTKQADPALPTALFCGKIKFRHLWKPGSLDVFDCGGVYDEKPVPASEEKKLVPALEVAARAVPYILEKKPALCFIHMPDGDTIGHKIGWGTPEQLAAFKDCDNALGQILAAIDQAGLRDSSTILLSADHGGKERNHFNPIPEDIHIPWVAWGKGVAKATASRKKPS